jgi:hypothetical protein
LRQLLECFIWWFIAHEKLECTVFNGIKRHSFVNLLRMLAVLRGKELFGVFGKNGFDASQEDGNVEILLDRLDREAREVLKTESCLELAVEGFFAPTKVVERLEGVVRVLLLISERRYEDFTLVAIEGNAYKSQAEGLG